MSKGKYVIKSGELAGMALRFAKFNKGTIDYPFLRYMNPRFSNAPNTYRMLSTLVRYQLLREGENCYVLTSLGEEAVRLLAERDSKVTVGMTT
jgi:hypothetical protein